MKNYEQIGFTTSGKKMQLEFSILFDYFIHNLDKSFVKRHAKSSKDFKKIIIADFFNGVGFSKAKIKRIMGVSSNQQEFTQLLTEMAFLEKLKDETAIDYKITPAKSYRERDLRNVFVNSFVNFVLDHDYFKELSSSMENFADIKTTIVLDSYCNGFNVGDMDVFGGLETALLNHISKTPDKDVLLQKYELLDSKGLEKEAINCLTYGFKKYQDPDFLLQIALHFYNKGNVQKSYEICEASINKLNNEQLYGVHILMGDIQFESLNPTNAMEHYTKAILANPVNPLGWKRKLSILSQSDNIYNLSNETKINELFELAHEYGVILERGGNT